MDKHTFPFPTWYSKFSGCFCGKSSRLVFFVCLAQYALLNNSLIKKAKKKPKKSCRFEPCCRYDGPKECVSERTKREN